VRRTLEKIGISRAPPSPLYDLYQTGGPEALDDRHPKPIAYWNRFPDVFANASSTWAERDRCREGIGRGASAGHEGYFVSEARLSGCSGTI